MERVTGIGGIFFKSPDPAALGAWYRTHLGVDVQSWGGAEFPWQEDTDPARPRCTVWSPFKDDTTYFAPSSARFMVNFRVDDLDRMRAQLKALGDQVDDKVEESEQGRFGWVMDPDGTRIELWQPAPGPAL